MGVIRSFLGFVVVIMLTTSLVAGNAVVAADRTVANEDFVTTTLEEEGAYEAVQSIASNQTGNQVDEADLPVSIDTETVINETLTTDYLQNETEANVRRAFGYLEGDREELNVSVNIAPLKRNVARTIERTVRDQSESDLVGTVSDVGNASATIAGAEFDLHRLAVRMENMSESNQSYHQEREAFRDKIRDSVVREIANESYDESVAAEEYDRLLGLVIEDYDPSNYTESEKAQRVDEDEAEIKTELEADIEAERGDEIENRTDDQLGEINGQASGIVASTVNTSLSGTEFDGVAEPATAMMVTGIDGLTGNSTYQEYDAARSESKSDLAENVSALAIQTLDEQVDDRYNLLENDQVSNEDKDRITGYAEDARDGYGVSQSIVMLLPLLSLGLIGLLFLITRSVSTTALLSGIPMALIGLITYGVTTAAPDQVESEVGPELQSSGLPSEAVDTVVGVIEQTLGVVASQSLILGLAGVALVVGGVALRITD